MFEIVDFLRKGGFRKKLASKAVEYTSCLEDDKRLALEEIIGSEAHAIMLCEQKIISRQEVKKILAALEEVKKEWMKGQLSLDESLEDIHPNIEAQVIKKAGEAGAKLHTARSRNDQVALDIRMVARKEVIEVISEAIKLIEIMTSNASKMHGVLVPGFTHTQPAQAMSFAQVLCSYAQALLRDCERLLECFKQVNKSPLGAGPLAGTTLQIDREKTRQLLGFQELLENPVDAVSSRDYALQMQAAIVILLTNLSRIAEDIVLWTLLELVEVSEEYTYTSSAMPQKRDPYVAEMLRAKASRAIGELNASFSIAKAMPSGYNKDFQEMKPLLWNAFDAAKDSLQVMQGMLKQLKVNESKSEEICRRKFVTAMDFTEFFVKQGIPFRKAYELVAAVARERNITGKAIEEKSKRVLGKAIKVSEKQVQELLDPQESMKKKDTTAKELVSLKKKVSEVKKANEENKQKVENALKELEKRVKDYLRE